MQDVYMGDLSMNKAVDAARLMKTLLYVAGQSGVVSKARKDSMFRDRINQFGTMPSDRFVRYKKVIGFILSTGKTPSGKIVWRF